MTRWSQRRLGALMLGASLAATIGACGGLVRRDDTGPGIDGTTGCDPGQACCDGAPCEASADATAATHVDAGPGTALDAAREATATDAAAEKESSDGSLDGAPDSSGGSPAPSAPLASCAPGGPGMTGCGATSEDSGESCCTTLDVEGGTFDRTFTWEDGGLTGEADPVTVSSFRLDKYLVTVGRFRQFVQAWDGGAGYTPLEGAGKHTYLNGGSGLLDVGSDAGTTYETGWTRSSYILSPTDTDLACDHVGLGDATWTPSPAGNEYLPIDCVSWFEAYAFCIWDGGFLPSEAEWGYAAAGGSEQRLYPWGSADPEGNIQYAISECTYPSGVPFDCGYVETNLISYMAPVGTTSLGAARWGQLDMAGLVDEWNLDWNADYVAGCTDCAWLTINPASQRVLRGGDFFEPTWDLPTSYRDATTPVNRNVTIGFRCARAP